MMKPTPPRPQETLIPITIRRTKHKMWVIYQGMEWRVEGTDFGAVADEALHYGLMYNCLEAVRMAVAERNPMRPTPRGGRRGR